MMDTALTPLTFPTVSAHSIPVTAMERPRLRYSRDSIVFLHGLGCAGSVWEPMLAMAHETTAALDAYRLISIDLPGHGHTAPSHDTRATSSWRSAIIAALEMLLPTDVVHIVAHSASLPFALEAMAYVDEYYRPQQEGALGSVVSIEGNHTLSDCGAISRQVSEHTEAWYVAAGHLQIGQELESRGLTEMAAWARMWHRADPKTVWGIAADLCRDLDYVELEHYWNAYPYRAYLYGDASLVPKSTRQIMSAPYPDPPTACYTVPGTGHFPMVTAPAETLHLIATALQDLESCR